MLIKEAIKMLSKMNPNEEVFIQFKEDVVEQRDNEHLKDKDWRDRYGYHNEGVGDR
jgi:hypothetical protein